MSSYDGGGFDEWLEDSFQAGIDPEKWRAIKAIMDPHRESIAIALEGFEPDEMSWRTFRNNLWYGREEEMRKIDAILRGEIDPASVLVLAHEERHLYGAMVEGP